MSRAGKENLVEYVRDRTSIFNTVSAKDKKFPIQEWYIGIIQKSKKKESERGKRKGLGRKSDK